jgi:hypothetical protein
MAPLFILGLQRSGTTLLYEIFAASGAFNISTAWHVICFDELRRGVDDPAASRQRLQERFAAAGLTPRGMDIVKIGPDTPEEYGFVLAGRGLGMRITRRSLPVFEEFCEVVRRYPAAGGKGFPVAEVREGIHAGARFPSRTTEMQDSHPAVCGKGFPLAEVREGILAPAALAPAAPPADRPLVLKNTWDFGNAARIKALVPGARFVFIHRNPVQIVSSLYRVVRKAVLKGFPYLELLSDRFRRFAAGGVPLRLARLLCARMPGLLARGVVHFVAHQARGHLRGLSVLNTTDYIDVRYEDLCAHPNETMARLLAFAGVDPGAAGGPPVDYRPMIGPHATHVEAEIIDRRRLVVRRLARYATAIGYDLSTLGEGVGASPRKELPGR